LTAKSREECLAEDRCTRSISATQPWPRLNIRNDVQRPRERGDAKKSRDEVVFVCVREEEEGERKEGRVEWWKCGQHKEFESEPAASVGVGVGVGGRLLGGLQLAGGGRCRWIRFR